MTNPMLTRVHLEATLVALAVVQPDRRDELLARVDRLRVSPTAVALLELLAAPADDAYVFAGTDGQRTLMQRVETITVFDLTFWPLDVLLSLVNQLPERAEREPAWQRDLDVARGSVA